MPCALDYIFGLVHDAIVRQANDGRLSVVLNGDGTSDAGAVDPACIGESIYYLLTLDPDHPRSLSDDRSLQLSNSIERMLDFVLKDCPRGPVGDDGNVPPKELLSHRVDAVQIWSDTVYMLPPFLASSAVYYSQQPNDKYNVQELVHMTLDQIILASQVLQAPTREWSHIYDLETQAFKRKAFWGVGNGWACCGIVRVLRIFAAGIDQASADSPFIEALSTAETAEKIQQCHTILIYTLNACINHIRPDGLFHDILDDPETFIETNPSQQVAYTLFRVLDLYLHCSDDVRTHLGIPFINNDMASTWEILGCMMRNAAVRKTDEWGFVQGVCGSPHFDRSGTAAEGQAWAILMEVAKAEYDSHDMEELADEIEKGL